jgi:hypothetical protein
MSTYPTILAGQRITSGLLTSMLPNIIYKAQNEDRTSTTTLTADSELSIDLEANAVYFIDMEIHYAADTGQFKTTWSVPTGATGNRSSLGAASNATSYDNVDGRFGVHNYGTEVPMGDRNNSGNQVVAIERSIITTSTTAGSLTLMWAQNVSSATITRVAAGSFIIAHRIS